MLLYALSRQKNAGCEVIMLDQIQDAETKALCTQLSNENIKFIYDLFKANGLSDARNEGIKRACCTKILFTDADGIPAENWAEEMSKALSEPNVAIVGSKILPIWLGKPNILTKSTIMLDQYSVLDMGDDKIDYTKAIGVSFGLDMNKLREEGYFDKKYGRRNGILISGEETELCARIKKKGFRIRYIPGTFVYHQISKERCRFRWALKRLYYAGYSRSCRGGLPNPNNSKRNIYDFILAPIIAPVYLAGYLNQSLCKVSSKPLSKV
jgi:GT2 family glycosyltransferase